LFFRAVSGLVCGVGLLFAQIGAASVFAQIGAASVFAQIGAPSLGELFSAFFCPSSAPFGVAQF
jgi:hypothetical protein